MKSFFRLLGHSPSVSHGRMALLVVLYLEAAAPFWTLAPLCWALLARPDVFGWPPDSLKQITSGEDETS